MTDTLFLIPARGGSKGVPGKNIKLLNQKPLLWYTIEVARTCTADEHICLSSDDDNIIKSAEECGLRVYFRRPDELASDEAGMDGVILHALNHFKNLGKEYKKLILLQPTSPFRKKEFIHEAYGLLDHKTDMVVSVRITDANPYYVLYEENSNGFLEKSKTFGLSPVRRQDAPVVYQLNGSIYVINVESFLKHKSLAKLPNIKKYLMENIYSLDIDTMLDWYFCEFLLKEKIINL